MTLAVLAAAVGLATVLLALYRDSTVLPAPACASPDWDPLPAPADVARADFPLAVTGYEPVAVDVALERLAQAYADLLAEAPPDVRRRAHRRAAVRLGADPEAFPPHVELPLDGAEVGARFPGGPDGMEALRAAAALAALEHSEPVTTEAGTTLDAAPGAAAEGGG